MRVQVQGIGVAAPGLGDWLTARAVLTGQTPYAPGPFSPASPAFLPPNERRRVPPIIRLALQAAAEAAPAGTGADGGYGAVFASAWGDLETMDRILTALARPERPVSPTQFHNSVHNAAAAYWSIGTGSPAATSAIGAGQATFSAGLLEAAALGLAEGRALLAVYDALPPAALRALVPVSQPFAVALLLAAPGAPGGAALELAIGDEPPSALEEPPLEALRRANPAAAALPLLRALALGGGAVALPYHNGRTVRAAVLPAGA
jgi:hypothetical protein